MERRAGPVTLSVLISLVGLVLIAGLTLTAGPPEKPGDSLEPGRPETPSVTRSAAQRSADVDGYALDYCGNAEVTDIPESTRRIVIVIHGLSGDACNLAQAALDVTDPDTVVVAPLFTSSDLHHLSWIHQSWIHGDVTRPLGSDRDPGPSSFTVVDRLIGAMGAGDGEGPDLVIAGFSAGGQFVNRYAAASSITADEYIVMAPSSYLWFDEQRPEPRTSGEQASACSAVNQWKFGLENRNQYAAASTKTEMRERYSARNVLYVVGGEDDSPTSRGLDHSCGAEAQGSNRLERMENYHQALERFFGPDIHERHEMRIVPGVAHNGPKLLRSASARQVLRG